MRWNEKFRGSATGVTQAIRDFDFGGKAESEEGAAAIKNARDPEATKVAKDRAKEAAAYRKALEPLFVAIRALALESIAALGAKSVLVGLDGDFEPARNGQPAIRRSNVDVRATNDL